MTLEEYTKKYGNKKVDEKKLNELLGIKEDKVWVPQKGELYWWINDGGGIEYGYNTMSLDDNNLFSMGNYYKTKKQAQFEADKRRFLTFMEISLRRNEETLVNLDDPMQDKFALYINSGSDTIRLLDFRSTYTVPKRYITTNREYLRQFALTHSKELLKYYFEIKE